MAKESADAQVQYCTLYRTPEESSPEKPEVRARLPEAVSPGGSGSETNQSLSAAHLEESGRLQRQILGMEKQIQSATAQAGQRESELKSERAKVQRIAVSFCSPLPPF